jgi:signal transduction histidine kinase
MTQRSPVGEARRLFLVTQGIRVAMSVVALVMLSTLGLRPRGLGWALLGLGLVSAIAAVPWFEHLLGSAYLAVALALDVLLTSCEAIPLFFRLGVLWPELEERFMAVALVEPFLLLLIPLVLFAWAYGRRGALLASTWASFLHLGTGLWALQQEFFGPEFLAGSGMRIALLYAVPFIVSTLARREQRQLAQLQAAYARLQRHAATVEQLAVSRERNRMARDLHDTLAHSLAGLSVQLEALRTLVRRDPQAALQAVDEAAAVAKRGLEESRQAIGALRSDPVTTMGLIGALRGELRALEARTGVAAELSLAGEESDLTQDEAEGLFRIAQEALSNVEQHAAAQRVTVSVLFAADHTEMTVRDDGVGFDRQAIGDDRYGLTGMQERAAMLGARLQVRGGPESGTEVHLSLPR